MTHRVKRVDLRPMFAKWGLPLKSQGKRPTCSVFAMTAALEFAVALRQESGTILSEEFLNWASNDAVGQFEDGGFFSDLWQGYLKHGICEERLAPYSQEFDPAWEPSKEARRQAHVYRDDAYELSWIKPWDVTTGLTDEELEGILQAIRDGLPVCAGMRWPKTPVWENGTLAMCEDDEVFDGHSVLLVGFALGRDEEPGDVAIIKDSGNGGRYAYLPLEYVRRYTNDAAVISD